MSILSIQVVQVVALSWSCVPPRGTRAVLCSGLLLGEVGLLSLVAGLTLHSHLLEFQHTLSEH